jgi:hypothetical protein
MEVLSVLAAQAARLVHLVALALPMAAVPQVAVADQVVAVALATTLVQAITRSEAVQVAAVVASCRVLAVLALPATMAV